MKKIIILSAGMVFAANISLADTASMEKACNMSKNALAKHPTCTQDLKDAGAKVDCTKGMPAIDEMNKLQMKCKDQAMAAAPATAAKVEALKTMDTSDPRMAELKQKLEAAKAAKAAKQGTAAGTTPAPGAANTTAADTATQTATTTTTPTGM